MLPQAPDDRRAHPLVGVFQISHQAFPGQPGADVVQLLSSQLSDVAILVIEDGQEEHADLWVADETECPNEPPETSGLLGPHQAIGERSPIALETFGEEFAGSLLELVVLCLQQLDESLAVGSDVVRVQPVEGVGRLKPDLIGGIFHDPDQPVEEFGHLEELTEGR